MVLPIENTTLRRALNQWFARQDVKPRVVAEFEDSAVASVRGRRPGASSGISVERRLKPPAVAISGAAREALFRPPR